jgi:hypothetical protein
MHLLGSALFSFMPPVQQGVGCGSGRRAGDPKPCDDLMPDLPREDALDEQVLNHFWALVALGGMQCGEADRGVQGALQSSTCQGRPASGRIGHVAAPNFSI